MGDGMLKTDTTGAIKIPKRFLLPPNDPQELLDWVYGDRRDPLPISGSPPHDEYEHLKKQNIKYMSLADLGECKALR